MPITNNLGQTRVGIRKQVLSSPSASYLLDSYGGATAAYSLRKLRAGYTGSAIRVRRSNDNTTLDVGFDANGNLDTTSLLNFVGANNIALYSEELDNAYWTKKNTSVVSNQTIAPDGTTTADLISETTSTDSHGISPNYVSTSFPAGTSWNISTYVKKGTGLNAPNTFGIGFQHGLNLDTTVLFSFITEGAIDSYVGAGDSNVGSSMTSVGNGWYRCSVWGTAAVTHNKVACGSFRFNGNSNSLSPNAYTGKTDANIYIWGWQFSRALNDTSILTTKPYNKTTTLTAGNGFVAIWYDQSENGYNLIQNTAANQARIVLNGVLETLNGKPALVSKFNSANNAHYNATYNSTVTSPYTVFHIGSNVGSAAATYLFDSISVNPRMYSTSYNTTWLRIGGTLGGPSEFALTGYTQVITTQRIINAIYNGASSKLSINNGSYTQGDTKTSGANGLTLGASYANTLHATAYYQEHILYPSNQESNVNNIDNNINSYYSIY